MQKELHVLGPLLPDGYGFKTRISHGEEGTNVNIERFLGEMLVQYGERSVFLVLRTIFFPLHSKVNIKFLRFPLALSTGHQFRNTLTN